METPAPETGNSAGGKAPGTRLWAVGGRGAWAAGSLRCHLPAARSWTHPFPLWAIIYPSVPWGRSDQVFPMPIPCFSHQLLGRIILFALTALLRYSSYHIIHPSKVYNPVVFSTFMELCNHHQINFHHPQRNPISF